MSENDALNGNGDDVRVDARFLALLAHYYTIEILEDWIARADGGMRVRKNQVTRWRRALAWLRQEQAQEQVSDGSD